MPDRTVRSTELVPSLVAREAERARLDAFAASNTEGARAVVLTGDPGCGKTVLWRYGIEKCRRRGTQLLLTRAAEEEMPLLLVAIADLFGERYPDLISPEDDRLTNGRSVLERIRQLTESQRVLLAFDDLQWLDSASAGVLRYALRRVADLPVSILATVRSAEDTDPLGLQASLGPDRVSTMTVGPLGLEDLRRVLDPVIEAIPRPALRRIHQVSGGNPLYAIELARVVDNNRGAMQSLGAVALPSSLREAIAQRLQNVPDDLLRVLQVVAAAGPCTVDTIQGAGAADAQQQVVDAAERGLLVIEEDRRIQFQHPLVASAVYARMNPLDRRSLHGRLATVFTNPDVRARHLALSSEQPDEEIAALLESAAERAVHQSAPDAAAELARHSLRLTPTDDETGIRRRTLAEIGGRVAAGEMGQALVLADGLVARSPPGPARAAALVRRAQLEDEDLARGESFLIQALQDAADDAALRGEVLDQLGWLRGIFYGDLPAGISCARESLEIAEAGNDDEFLMSSIAGLAVMSALAGRPEPDLMARSVELQDTIGRPGLWAGPRTLQAEQLLWAGELEEARSQLEAELEHAVREGNERWRLYDLYDLASVECAAGNLSRAEDLTREALDAARDSEDPHVESWIMQRQAQVAAWLGRTAEASTAAGQRIASGTRRRERTGVARMRGLLGMLALSAGDAGTAATELSEAAQLLDDCGFANPGAIPVLPDAVEAVAGTGDLATAEVLLDRLHGQATQLGNSWVQAAYDRSRGVLSLATGDLDTADALLASSAETFDRSGHRPDAARATLSRGRALLRAGQRTRAAEVLSDAEARFAAMGAVLWQARATKDLERVAPGRSTGELTDTERTIVALVADGNRNREVAATLFLSVATVEAHLTRIYRKVGIRSRSELVRLVADGNLETDR